MGCVSFFFLGRKINFYWGEKYSKFPKSQLEGKKKKNRVTLILMACNVIWPNKYNPNTSLNVFVFGTNNFITQDKQIGLDEDKPLME